jgi:uncharacterized protein YbjT (DUF2867 family)
MHCEVAAGCNKGYGGFPEPVHGMVTVDPVAGDAAAKLLQAAAAADAAAGKSLLQTESHVQTMTVKARRFVRVPGTDEIQTVLEDLTLPRMN